MVVRAGFRNRGGTLTGLGHRKLFESGISNQNFEFLITDSVKTTPFIVQKLLCFVDFGLEGPELIDYKLLIVLRWIALDAL